MMASGVMFLGLLVIVALLAVIVTIILRFAQGNRA